MLFKTLIALNALAGAVAASPASQLHKGQADLEMFIQNEKPIAHQGILNNIGANGKLVQGASPGIVVASPSKDPNCMKTFG
jgi:glucoamylase